MKKSHDKISIRLIQIIMKFNNGEKSSVEELAAEFNVNIRTIQRDLNERLSYLPIIKENGYYFMESYALGKLSFEDIKNFATLSGIKSLYPDLGNNFISDILNIKLSRAYLVKNQGFEDISHRQDWFEQISGAILKLSPTKFFYNEKVRAVNPYKLVNNNGVWYLLADEDGKLKNFTFSKIKQFHWDDAVRFTPKKEFLEKILQNDSNWFSDTMIEVVLEIDNEAKEYFLRKEILSNKKIIEQTKDKLVILTKVSYDDEILRIVKYWLPYIRIVSPIYLQEKLNNTLKEYLKTTQPVITKR